jgi:hypothetical protein
MGPITAAARASRSACEASSRSRRACRCWNHVASSVPATAIVAAPSVMVTVAHGGMVAPGTLNDEAPCGQLSLSPVGSSPQRGKPPIARMSGIALSRHPLASVRSPPTARVLTPLWNHSVPSLLASTVGAASPLALAVSRPGLPDDHRSRARLSCEISGRGLRARHHRRGRRKRSVES